MTTELISPRDERAQAMVEKIIRRTLPSPAPTEITISARANHSGEPSLYVYVVMPEERSIPDIETQNRLSSDVLTALQMLDDDRFPYFYYGPREPDTPTRRRSKTA